MIQVIEERSEGQQQQFGIDGVSLRMWEEGNQVFQVFSSQLIQIGDIVYVTLVVVKQCGQIVLKVQWSSQEISREIEGDDDGQVKQAMQYMLQLILKRYRHFIQIDELITQLPCKHIYHKSCVDSWLQSSTKCPNCRSDVLEALKNMEK
ncbi:unnamed protein product (macronuclear) [Paramecium tetraurelia]|uniref:RING-type domain-containing protein n=1 Tax=Paramecium tetraurelia TaxID=5888 RepID=A0D4F4_PARTE|nr:uncharacterized protein GSPATT00013387001 [Paramecium tetraurelia]CAK77921.1 unnamed protein product [Paramecium tetraurelia]|eukprot:XP_001445318.1 hypothetical protein (macronuclear) [Paramecium tetraurelia strain d4-2]